VYGLHGLPREAGYPAGGRGKAVHGPMIRHLLARRKAGIGGFRGPLPPNKGSCALRRVRLHSLPVLAAGPGLQ